MASQYRRRRGGSPRWHSHESCPDWPETDYVEQSESPRAEEQCDYCASADDADDHEDGDENGGNGNGD
jgi:hypothetical protein